MKVRGESETKREGMRREMKGETVRPRRGNTRGWVNRMLTYNSVRFLLLDPLEKGTKHSVVWYLKYKLTFVSRFMFILIFFVFYC